MTWILSLLSGALLGLSMPPHAAWGLEWVALVPLFIAVRRSGPLKAFGLGILTVLISSFFLIFPLRSSEEWGNAGGGLGLFALLIGWTCAFGAASRTASPLKWSLWMGAAGVLGEALAHAVFPIYLAMGQWQNVPIMSVASWTGIWGVSFLLYSFNAAIAYLLERSLGKGRFDAKSALSSVEFRFALIFVVLLGGLHAFGLWRMRQKIPGAPLRMRYGESEKAPPGSPRRSSGD
jgi:apolipoprotein N-acyltransferase